MFGKSSAREYEDTRIDYYQNSCNTGFEIFESLVSGVAGFIDNQSERNHQDRIYELQVQENEMNLQYEAEIAREQTNALQIQAQRDIELAQVDALTNIEIERNRAMIQAQRDVEIENRRNELAAQTEQLKISEQSKVLQKVLDTALAKYTRTVDFYQSQLQSAENFFLPQIKSMDNELLHLRQLQDKAFNDTENYIYLQKQINRLSEYRDGINDRYSKLQTNLTTAVRLAQLESPSADFDVLGLSDRTFGCV